MQKTQAVGKMSLCRTIGFACNQGFVFFLFYMGLNRGVALGPYLFERMELFGVLVCMVVCFAAVRAVPQKVRAVLFAPLLLALYAAMLVLGSLIPLLCGDGIGFWVFAESVLLGLPTALLLTAWGRVFGETTAKLAVPEVFVGSIAGAMVGLAVSLVPLDGAEGLLRILPFGSALALFLLLRSGKTQKESLLPGTEATDPKTELLSLKIIAGTVLFGMAAGFMETFKTSPGSDAMPFYPVSFLLFGAFAIGTLSLLVSDGFGKGAALNKAYRIAFFVMIVGYLLIPVPQFSESLVPGEAIVLAGYLGLTTVFISLFIVLAKITGTDVVASFSRGFSGLFAGELLGVGIANAIDLTQPDFVTPYSVVVLAAILVLFSYVFLFTERDFNNLSEIVKSSDSFEDRCRAIAAECALSVREAEILPFALRGRTSERISQELHISKSTVDTHLRRIYAKADVHSRQELLDLSERKDSRR